MAGDGQVYKKLKPKELLCLHMSMTVMIVATVLIYTMSQVTIQNLSKTVEIWKDYISTDGYKLEDIQRIHNCQL